MTRVAVCGGRGYGIAPACLTRTELSAALRKAAHERDFLWATLSSIHMARRISVLIHGGAPGADRHAKRWAVMNDIQTMGFPADWSLGPRAGPLRNQRMIDEGEPDLVVAFPGGRGTADMVRRAKAAGIEVLAVSPSPMGAGG